MESERELIRDIAATLLDKELVKFESAVQQHEALLKSYGVYEKVQRYVANTPTRLQNRIAEELQSKKKMPAQSGLMRLCNAKKKEALTQVQERVDYYIGVAQHETQRLAFIADREREMDTTLISTGEAAKILNTTTEGARAKLKRHLEKEEIRGFCYKEERYPDMPRFWYWDKSEVQQLAKKRKKR